MLLFGLLALSSFAIYKFLSYRMDISALDKTIVVTGAASGIGKSLCKLLLSYGSRVIGVDIRTAEIYHPNFRFVAMDLSRVTQEQIKQAFAMEDSIYAIVNCAAISLAERRLTSIIEERTSNINAMFQTNVLGPITFTQALYPLLNNAMVINVASPTGILVPPYMGYYGVTKSALIGWNDGLRRESKHRVCCIMPGFTKTSMNFKASIESELIEEELSRCQEKLNSYLDKAQEADEVALTIMYNLFSSNYGYRVYADVWYMKLGWKLLELIQVISPTLSDYLLKRILC
jgi:NAD(P)-dependent dehydrogenase (short-subunit alcohol dehydrogenase family)